MPDNFSSYRPYRNITGRVTPTYSPLMYSPLATRDLFFVRYPGSSRTYKWYDPLANYRAYDNARKERKRQEEERKLKQQEQQSNILNYNDPFEINSFADILLNETALDLKYKGGLFDIPVLGDMAQRIVATGELIYKGNIKPLLEGKPDEALLNLLGNIGESLDIVANPVKGLLQEGLEGFVKGIGGPNPYGRVNYNWDTGNVLSDIALEIATDPLTWISGGAKIIGKRTLVSKGTEALENAIPTVVRRYGADVVQDAITDAGVRVFARDIARSTWRGNYKTLFEGFYDTAENIGKRGIRLVQEQVIKTGRAVFTPELRHLGVLQQILNEAGDYALQHVSMNAVRGLQKAASIPSQLSKIMFKGALFTNGLGLEIKGAQWLVKGFLGAKLTSDAARRALVPLTTTVDNEQLLPITKLKEATEEINHQVVRMQHKADNLTAPSEPVGAELAVPLTQQITEQAIVAEQNLLNKIHQRSISAAEELNKITQYVQQTHNMDLDEYNDYLVTNAIDMDNDLLSEYSDFFEARTIKLEEQANKEARMKTHVPKSDDLTKYVNYSADATEYVKDYPEKHMTYVDLSRNDKMYGIKSAQHAMHIELSALPEVKEFMTDVTNTRGLRRNLAYLRNYDGTDPTMKPYVDAAYAITRFVRGYAQYEELKNNLFAMPIPKPLKIALLDALERKSRTRIKRKEDGVEPPWLQILTSDNAEQIIKEVIDSSLVYCNAILQEEVNTMEVLATKYQLSETGYPQHTIRNDVPQARELLLKLSKKSAPSALNVLYVYDTETTGLDIDASDITEFGWTRDHDTPVVHNFDTPYMPPLSAIRSMYANELTPNMTNQQVHDWYLGKRASLTYTAPAKAYAAFCEDILYHLSQGFTVTLGGHNILGFDNDILLNNMYRVDPALGETFKNILNHPNIRIVDTLDILRKRQRHYEYTPRQRKIIERLLRKYIAHRLTVSKYTTLNAQFNSEFLQALKLFVSYLDATGHPEQSTKITKLLDALYGKLSEIKDTNAALEPLITFTQEDLLSNGLLNSTQLTHTDIQLISKYNAFIKYNPAVIKNFFNVTGAVPKKIARLYEETARKLSRVVSKLAPSKILEDISQDVLWVIRHYQQTLLRLFPMHINSNLWKTLYVSADPRERIAIAGFLMQELRKLNVANDLVYMPRIEHVLHCIKQTAYMYGNPIKYFTQDFSPEVLNIYEEAVAYNTIIKHCSDALEPLEAINKNLSADEKLFVSTTRASTMKQYGLLKTSLALYQKLLGILPTLNPRQQIQLTDDINSLGTKLIYLGARHVLTLPIEEFKKHLWHRSKSILVIDKNLFSPDDPIIQNILKDKGMYNTIGIKVEEKGTLLVISVKPEHYAEYAKLPQPKALRHNITVSSALPEELHKAFMDVWNLHNGLVYQGGTYSTGNIMSSSQYEVLCKYLKVADHYNQLYDYGVFKYSNMDYSLYVRPNERYTVIPKTSTNIFKQTWRSAQYLLQYADTRSSMVAMFADINNPMQMNNLFKDMSDRAILDLFHRHKHWRLGYLVIQKDTVKYTSAKPNTVKDVANLRKLHAVPVDKAGDGVYRKVFNDYALTDKMNKSLIGSVASLYKGVYLVSPTTGFGWLFNNFIDSFGRALFEAGGVVDLGRKIKTFFMAHRAINEWARMQQELLEISRAQSGDPVGLINEAGYEAYFRTHPPEDKILYDLVDSLLITVGGGQSSALEKALYDAGIYKQRDHTKLDRLVNIVWNNKLAKMFLGFSMKLENTVRLGDALYRYLEEDHTMLDAVAGALATHYDYTPRNQGEAFLEYVIPFSTFRLRNIDYWTNTASENGWMLRIMNEMLMPIFNLDENEQYELGENRSLLYNVLSGNIVLDNDMTIKTHSTALEALSTIYNPLQSTQESLYAPIRLTIDILKNLGNYGTGYEQYDVLRDVISNMPIPFLGSAIQQYWGLGSDDVNVWQKGSAAKAYERTGSLLPLITPGLFGSVSRNHYFSYGNGTVYMTHDLDNYNNHILRGAVPVRTYEEALIEIEKSNIYQPTLRLPEVTSTKYTQYNRSYGAYKKRGYKKYTRKRYVRKSYNRQIYGPSTQPYFRGTYVPYSSKYTAYTAERVLYRVRTTQMRLPGTVRNLAHTAPVLYKRIYSGTGAARFKSRLLSTTRRNIQSRIRQSWSYLR